MTDAAQTLAAHVSGAAFRGPTKYRSKATWVDGIRFASKREAARYGELRLMESAGAIRNLRCQVPYQLWTTQPGGNGPKSVSTTLAVLGKYIADFEYQDDTGKTHIEDAKGFRTPLYLWKKRHFEAQTGFRIEEV